MTVRLTCIITWGQSHHSDSAVGCGSKLNQKVCCLRPTPVLEVAKGPPWQGGVRTKSWLGYLTCKTCTMSQQQDDFINPYQTHCCGKLLLIWLYLYSMPYLVHVMMRQMDDCSMRGWRYGCGRHIGSPEDGSLLVLGHHNLPWTFSFCIS